MAELTAGAVNALLGVLRNELLLLGRLGSDVNYIKEEMESMNSFLAHLARRKPPGGMHDEQVRTWMKQVRDLAQDCSSCLDLYLRRGDPEIQRARGGAQRHLWWILWFAQKVVAQHRVAIELRALKERARDVGDRRVRYGVMVPEDVAGGSPLQDEGYQGFDRVRNDDDDLDSRRLPDDHRHRALQPLTPEQYCAEVLVDWVKQQSPADQAKSIPCVAIVAAESSAAVVRQVLALAADNLEHVVVRLHLPTVHYPWDLPLEASEIVSYIRREWLQKEQGTALESYVVEQWRKDGPDDDYWANQMKAYRFKWEDYWDVRGRIREINIDGKIREINDKIEDATKKMIEQAKTKDNTDQQGESMTKQARRKKITPLDLLMEALASYAQKVFPDSNNEAPLQTQQAMAATTAAALGEDQIKEIIRKMAPDIIRQMQLLEGGGGSSSSLNKGPEQQAPSTQPGGQNDQTKTAARDDALAAASEEAKKKLPEILEKIKYQMVLKGKLDKAKDLLKGKKILFIIQDDGDYISTLQWEYTRKALGLLDCALGSAVIVTTTNSQKARKFCSPEREPMTCSLPGVYYDRLLRLIGQHKKEDREYTQILRDILDKCDKGDEFSMKIFAHALRANPNRSNEELVKLQDRLLLKSPRNVANMFMFSYNDLHKEYKSCLLYLAIFPQGQKIRRSTLVGRWVVEGFISMEDWRTTVRRAERCFDMLIDRWFVDPGDVGATGYIKSCVVGKQVHDIITNIAKEQHIVEARLSHHLARHFSIFSDLRLRRSDNICMFVEKLHKYELQLPQLKVLDLESCTCFYKSDRYLKSICNKILLLKYLSLRGTYVTHLPREINHLHELEILDIRETKVPAADTKEIVLLKLKRLMAGREVYPSPSRNHSGSDGKPLFYSVQIPDKIAKMENMEVLSNVEASRADDELKDIGKLYHLRKLGVVISNKPSHLRNLVQAISDVNDSLESLSITLLKTESKGIPPSEDDSLPYHIFKCYEQPPKNLKSLNISGTTQSGQLFQLLLAKVLDKLTKVTLHNTSLNKENMKHLAKLPELRDFRLRHKSYAGRKLAFKKGKFQNLKNLLFEGSNMTEVIFGDEAAPKLESIKLSSAIVIAMIIEKAAAPRLKKIDLSDARITTIRFEKGAAPDLQEINMSSTNITSVIFEDKATPSLKKIALSNTNVQFLFGINYLPKLKEIELDGSRIIDINELGKVTLRGTSHEQADMQILASQPKLESLVLLSCNEPHDSHLSFNKDEFKDLKLLHVKCFGITNMSFAEGAAPKLEKIVWFFNKIESLSGIKNLTNLKEVELDGENVPRQVSEDIKHQKCALKLPPNQRHTKTMDTDSD
ncbi:hypothetical protein E2562_014556 [Oryza meyeriana var. granulata]|uniref:Uncharacterized protein n=1 Tax=Oryza meyeriana var. granulata TaxID=110450 RepID=A0A6G1EI57_9ORYZ|nr:hypothetical protein E2562_014556 [Oryza meyeriana var. granulata]